MIADNNLDYFAIQNINQMEEGYDSNLNGKLLVYIDRAKNASPNYPYLLEIIKDTTPNIVSKIIQTYPEQNSCDPSIIHNVLNGIKTIYKDFNSLGLIFWSHGSSWLPKGINLGTKRGQIIDSTKSFGLDQSYDSAVLSLNDFDIALNTINADFILFDACYMSSIEVVYELRNKAKYFISSCSEILSYGFPYNKIVIDLFNAKFNPISVAEKIFDFYNNQKGLYQSSTISVVYLPEVQNLADYTKNLISQIKDTANISFAKMQQLNYSGDTSAIPWAVDFKNYIENISNNESVNQKIDKNIF